MTDERPLAQQRPRREPPVEGFDHRTTRTIGYREDNQLVNVTLFFTWTGGPYIEVGIDGKHAVEVINVTADNAATTFEPTPAYMGALIDKWIKSKGGASLARHALETWYV